MFGYQGTSAWQNTTEEVTNYIYKKKLQIMFKIKCLKTSLASHQVRVLSTVQHVFHDVVIFSPDSVSKVG